MADGNPEGTFRKEHNPQLYRRRFYQEIQNNNPPPTRKRAAQIIG